MIGSRNIDAGQSSRHSLVPSAFSAAADAGFARAFAMARVGIETAEVDAKTKGSLLQRFDSAVDELNGRAIGTMPNARMDAIGAEGGALLAGQLRQVLKTVLEEKHPVPNALRLFNVDSSIKLGARTYAVRRFFEAGEARVHLGGSAGIPAVSLAQVEKEFRVRNYITSAVWDVFEEQSADFADLAYARKLTKIARDVLERFTNEMVWFGNSTYEIYGILNYPWLDKEVSDENFYGTPADTRTTLAALNGWVNRQHHRSKGVMGPNKMVSSPRVVDWIMQTPMGTTSAMRDRMLGEVFMASQEGRINGPIERAWELEDVLGEGIDAILFYRDDEQGISNMMVGGGIKSLPLHQTDMERRQIFFIASGGVMMAEVGNNLLIFVRAAAP